MKIKIKKMRAQNNYPCDLTKKFIEKGEKFKKVEVGSLIFVCKNMWNWKIRRLVRKELRL